MSTLDLRAQQEKRKNDLLSGREGTIPQNMPDPKNNEKVHLDIGEVQDLKPTNSIDIGDIKLRSLARDYVRNPKSKPDASGAGRDADFGYNSDEEMNRRSNVSRAGGNLKFARMNKMLGES